MIKQSTLILLCLVILASCSAPKLDPVEDGVPYKYLYDTERFIIDEVSYHKANTKQYIEVTSTDNTLTKFDTAYLRVTKVDWQKYITALTEINMHDTLYDRVFKMEQAVDTTAQRFDITYIPLYESLPLKTMQLSVDPNTNDLLRMYAQYKKTGLFTDVERTITYSRGKVLQVRETQDGTFSKPTTKIFQLYFKQVQKADEPKVSITPGN